jgi:uncharacterized membrane protein
MAIQDTMGPMGTHRTDTSRQNMYWLIAAVIVVLALIGFSMARSNRTVDVRDRTTTSDVNRTNTNSNSTNTGAPAGTQ